MQLYNVYTRYPLRPVCGRDCYLYTEDGTEYLDAYGGHAVISIGHSHPHYVRRITEQLQRLSYYSNSVELNLQTEFAARLGTLSGCADDYRLFLCNSGAEANENAIKMASFRTGNRKVIAFRGGFHGRTSAAVRVTDNPKIQAPLNRSFPVVWLPLDDIVSVRRHLDNGDCAAVIVEGIQGIGGVHLPTNAFLRQLSTVCTAMGVPLILDEIQSGYGRSGEFFAFQRADVRPDLITVAKGMANGFPMGGVLIHRKFEARTGELGSTFGGNPLACVAGLATLEVIEAEHLIQNARTTGAYLLSALNQLSNVQAVRGVGLMIGVEFPFPVAELRKTLLLKHHIFVGSSANPNTLRILPPLTFDTAAADRLLSGLQRAISSLPITTL